MMPADASGVTTDDQGSPHDESGHPAVAEGTSAGRAADARRPGEDAPAGGSDTSDLHGGNGAPAAAEPGQPFPTPAPHRDGGAPGAPDGSGDPTMPETGEIEGFGDATTQIDDPRPELAPAGLVPAGLPPGAEPPPAPVLIPTGGRFGRPRRALGRHVSRRRARASRRGLRVNQRLWSIDPWSVFKVSALFYLCLGLIIVVAGTLLYNAGRSVGTIEQFESFVTRMGAYGECTAKSEVPEGTEFREDDDTCGEGEVLVGGFMLDDGTLFRSGAIAVAVLVVSGAVGNVLLVVLLNLLNELTGGLRHTIIKEPVARAPTGGAARAPDPGRRPGSGSPPLPREG